jgi:predicted nucleic acid-binding protein
LDLARAGEIQLAVSDFILGEVGRVLHHKFGWSEEAIAVARAQIAAFCDQVQPERRIEAVSEDPTDNRILECAVAAGSEYLVTGDRHLLRLGRFETVAIVTAAELLEVYGNRVGAG